MKTRLISAILLCATSFCSADLSDNTINEAQSDIALGYRQDELNWTIGSNLWDGPNILSELSWNDLQIVQVQGVSKVVTCNHIVFKGMGDYGYIVSGKSRDSDYHGDNRTWEYSRSLHDSGNGFVFDASLAVGYQYEFLKSQLIFQPLVGYSVNSQHLKITNGRVVVSEGSEGIRKIHGLHSSYNTYWFGSWLGFDLDYKLNCQLDFFGGFEYHLAFYRAKGHWNLRDDLPNGFDHKANNGLGQVYTFGGRYVLCNEVTLALIANYQTFRTGHGNDSGMIVRENKFGHEIRRSFSQPLNRVIWRSASIMGTLGYHY